MKRLIVIVTLVGILPTAAQQSYVAKYNDCVTDKFLTMSVLLGNQKAYDQAAGACGHFIDEAFATAQREGVSGRDMLEIFSKNAAQLEYRPDVDVS